MRGVPGAVAGDRQFLHYAGARVAVAWAVAASAFITVFGSREFGASDADIARLTTVFLISQVAGSLGGGVVGDRFGVRSLLVEGSLASLGAVVFAALATDLILIYVAIAIAGLVSMLIVADITMVLDMAPESHWPAYMAALNLILGPLALPAPLILGLLVDVAGFRMMFAIAIALALIGLAAVLSFALRPPRTVEIPLGRPSIGANGCSHISLVRDRALPDPALPQVASVPLPSPSVTIILARRFHVAWGVHRFTPPGCGCAGPQLRASLPAA